MSSRRPRLRRSGARVLAVAVLVLSVGLGGCRKDSCDVEAQNEAVIRLMRDFYFFNGEPEQRAKYGLVSPASFASPEALLRVLRYEPDTYDRGFTYVTTPVIEEQFLDAGLFVGFGIGLDSSVPGELFIRSIVPGEGVDSPAAQAGLVRGDEILEIDGLTIPEIEASGDVDRAFGPLRPGVERTFLVDKRDGSGQQLVTLTKARFQVDVVPDWGIYDVGMEQVGYLLFDSFIPTAVPDLRAAFQEFATQGITKIVVDLRYNGGGLLSLAESITNVLGGDGHVGEVQFSARFRSQEPAPREEVVFGDDPDAFPIDTIAFITTGRTASASELLVNALGPYRNVIVVGDTTLGKPVGQGAADYCFGAYRLRLVAFDLVNADGVGEYYGGIDPTCPAADDLSHDLGDPLEASLATALDAAATGACPSAPAPARAPRAAAAGVTPAWLGPPAVPWLDVY